MNIHRNLGLMIATSLVAVSATGCAELPDESGTDSSALVGAPIDEGDPWAVGVCGSTPNTNPAKGAVGACLEPGTRCTGALVAPNLVLTARHCVKAVQSAAHGAFCDARFSNAPLSTTKPSVTLSPSVLQENPTWITVSEVLVPSTNNGCDDDIALLVLAKPQLDVPMARIDLNTNLAVKAPNRLAIVGRGGLTDQIDPTTFASINVDRGGYVKRVLTDIPFLCASDTNGACTVADATTPGGVFALRAGQFSMGPGGAPGDSGAGVLSAESYASGTPTIVGVVSTGTYDPVTGVGNAGVNVRVSPHKAFLVSGAILAAARGNYAVPSWAK